MPQAEPSLASVWTVSSTLPGSSPMMTALPPAATTSSAVWRPIPLLPPTTTSFCPAKTGMDIDRPGCSMLWSLPSSQFMLIGTFLSTGCTGVGLLVAHGQAWPPRSRRTPSGMTALPGAGRWYGTSRFDGVDHRVRTSLGGGCAGDDVQGDVATAADHPLRGPRPGQRR